MARDVSPRRSSSSTIDQCRRDSGIADIIAPGSNFDQKCIAPVPQSKNGAAASVAEGIRKSVSAKKLRRKGTEGELGPITASFGVSSYIPGEDLKQLIERADRALYEAKKFGRNRVMSEAGEALQQTG